MAGEIQVTVIGNLTADPELRFTPSGAAVANFTVASTPRFFKDGEWRDGDPTFLRCNIWRQAAENVAESFQRGDRVIVVGKLQQRSFETKEGEKRSTMELQVDEIGPSVKFKAASVQRAERRQTADDPWGDNQAPGPANGAAADPWGSAPARPAQGSFSDEPPF
jgi:single-strand DNA-binding protein